MSHPPIEFPVEGLVGDTVRLRLAADADRSRFVEACQDEAIQRFTVVPAGYTDVHAREYAHRAAIGFADGTAVSLVIADPESDELLGSIALLRDDRDPDRWSAGYWVAPWARERGVATAALRLICAHGFEQLGAARIDLCTAVDNPASARVAERAGFSREGLLRSYIAIGGQRHDAFMYSLLPGDTD